VVTVVETHGSDVEGKQCVQNLDGEIYLKTARIA
jgi:hypothetical protein